MGNRYERNMPAISQEDQAALTAKRVFVAGCGGLGGYVVEILARIGVGFITVADGDIFTQSNLNRQLFSTSRTLGLKKAECARERIKDVNPEAEVLALPVDITEENAAELVGGHDVIVDALDNGKSRLLLANAARAAGTPLVSGAISGWYGRVLVLLPEDNADFLWEGTEPAQAGNLCPTAACVASIQASETVKLLLGRPGVLLGRLLEIDLLNSAFEEVPLATRYNR